ncbi:hypothetical protein ROSMUCSMR3_02944 [Roseovarius mucosus]|uniref:Uncharacterized protein n=1 Tax=Roseovarius mucosus TaxID=215743 RepID=A0A1V0RRL3_9RHOB|nr:hypothetical protein ROSMUCSMR3_02944 [Roseovarius mucosus]
MKRRPFHREIQEKKCEFTYDSFICEGVRYRDIAGIWRSMHGWQSYLGEIKYSENRCVFHMGSWYEEGNKDPRDAPVPFSRRLGISIGKNPYEQFVWELKFIFAGGVKYFDFASDEERSRERDDGSCNIRHDDLTLRDVWHDEDIVCVELHSSRSISQFKRDIRDFIVPFKQAKQRVANPNVWRPAGLKAEIVCWSCGHNSETEAHILTRNRPTDDIFSLERRMKCKNCGTVGKASILPLFKESTRYAVERGRAYIERRRSSVIESTQDVDLYDVLGGDGTNSVYVGDGLNMRPDGSFSDY